MNPSPDEQKNTILAYAHKRLPRPILIGEMAVLLGWWATLKDTEIIMNEMVAEGLLRCLTEEERRGFGIRHGYLAV